MSGDPARSLAYVTRLMEKSAMLIKRHQKSRYTFIIQSTDRKNGCYPNFIRYFWETHGKHLREISDSLVSIRPVRLAYNMDVRDF